MQPFMPIIPPVMQGLHQQGIQGMHWQGLGVVAGLVVTSSCVVVETVVVDVVVVSSFIGRELIVLRKSWFFCFIITAFNHLRNSGSTERVPFPRPIASVRN